ncbi:cysteine--tRNA ligase [Candidatus Uhrbacteria bacterium]|nr:cysteine--tRNA ligase [Candidatus Uhrbacteria bacterium]
MLPLHLYNTLSRTKELFQPLKPGKVGLYTCGPTVYSDPHIGNLRTYLFEDILRRVLAYAGYKVKHVMNITDVGHLTGDRDMGEDKMQKSAREQRKTAWDLAKLYTLVFKENMKDLHMLAPDIWCKATDHIKEQVALIQILEKKGFTYQTSDGVYFDTARLPDYGKLAHLNIEGLREGARVEVNDEKKNPTDFALWKLSNPLVRHPERTERVEGSTLQKRDMEWPSPWGVGFPGWHIECSAMSMKYLGETFDMHCGGVDHIAVHHTNEIAQSEAATGKQFVKYWMHGEFLIINEGRMGKSEGNAMTLVGLKAKAYDPLAYRYLTLTAHYRQKLNFTWESLDAAQNALNNLRDHVRALKPEHPVTATDRKLAQNFQERFDKAITDDLNMPEALALTWDMLKSELEPRLKKQLVKTFDKIFGLGLDKVKAYKIPPEIKKLARDREAARKKKDWAKSDEIRKHIESLGWKVEDTEKGFVLRK